MKKLIFILLLLFPVVCYSQTRATASCRVSATIIAIEDTAKYAAEQALIFEQGLIEDTITVEIGDTKSYLISSFEQPDEKLSMPYDNKKEIWTYGNLVVYITDGKVESTRIMKIEKTN